MTTAPEYIEIGGQRIRVDRCPDCDHPGHEGRCPARVGVLNIDAPDESDLTPCDCGEDAASRISELQAEIREREA